jgi:hypothetical protein
MLAAVADSAADEAARAEVMPMAMIATTTSVIRTPDDSIDDDRSVGFAPAFASSLA